MYSLRLHMERMYTNNECFGKNATHPETCVYRTFKTEIIIFYLLIWNCTALFIFRVTVPVIIEKCPY